MDKLSSLFVGVAAAGVMLGLLLNSGPGASSPQGASVTSTALTSTALTSTTHPLITPVGAAPVR